MPKKNSPPAQFYHSGRPNCWGMIRDITIAAINKGQFLMAIVAAIIIIILIRMPSDRLFEVMDKLVEKLEDWYITGWAFFLLSIGGWFFTARFMRTSHADEIKRTSEEKTRLQEALLGKTMGTSKK